MNILSRIFPARTEYPNHPNLVSLLKQIREERNKVTLADLKRAQEPPRFDATLSELEQTPGASVWVYTAINSIAEDSSSVRWKAVNTDNEEIENPLPEKPNSMMTWYFMRYLTSMHLDITGMAYWLHDRETNEYFPIRPSRIKVVPAKNGRSIAGFALKKEGWLDIQPTNNGNKYFYVRNEQPVELEQEDFDEILRRWKDWVENGIVKQQQFQPVTISRTGGGSPDKDWIPLSVDDVVYFRYPNASNDYYGQSPLQPLLPTITTEMFARGWNKNFFENGAIPPIVLYFPEGISEEEFTRVKSQYEQKQKGVPNAWKTLVLEQTQMEIQKIEMTHTDMDFLNLMKTSREEILAVYRVPPIKAGIYDFATGGSRSSGAKEQRDQYWNDTIFGRLTLQDDTINNSKAIDLGEGNKLSFALDEVEALMPDLGETAKAAKDAILGGLTLEEVRRIFWQRWGVTETPGDFVYLPQTLIPTNIDDDNTSQELSYELVSPTTRKY